MINRNYVKLTGNNGREAELSHLHNVTDGIAAARPRQIGIKFYRFAV